MRRKKKNRRDSVKGGKRRKQQRINRKKEFYKEVNEKGEDWDGEMLKNRNQGECKA